ncbi:unnamed protein product [Closterium sp. Naga37s-1]|nr:unnamed protein product [Closterium sp. Naga37s-1]
MRPAAFRGCCPIALSSARSRPVAMTGKRRSSSRSDRSVGSPAAPSHSQARGELAPALLRAAAALVAHEEAGSSLRRHEPVYRSPRERTHPHLRARGGSFRRRRPPRHPPAVQREIVGPLCPTCSHRLLVPTPRRCPSASLQSSQQLSSVPAESAPSTPLAPPHPPAPPAAVGAPLVLPAGVPPTPSASSPGDPPQRLHPLIPLDPSPVARFPPPRCHSPPLPPDAPDPEDDEAWWNGDSWESPPQSGTLGGRDWDIRSDFVLDVLRWERRMIGVGECLSHVATALEQLHVGLEARNLVLQDPQLTEPQQGLVPLIFGLSSLPYCHL